MARRASTRSKRAPDEPPFWKAKPLAQMTRAEWESLCDGCGKCCLLKLEYEDTGEIARTNVACRQLDLQSCRCRDYANRQRLVPDCVKITPDNVKSLDWLPHTCAYRLVAFGFDLPRWHHLVCGDPERVHTRGHSMRGALVSEDEVDWAS